MNQTAWTDSGSTVGGVDSSVAGSLCNNLYNRPCGGSTVSSEKLEFLKFQVRMSGVWQGPAMLSG